MEDKLLCMKCRNKCLPFLNLVDGQYKFIGDFVDPIRNDVECVVVDNSFQVILSVESNLDDDFFVNAEGIVEYRKPVCSKCNSHKVIKKGYNWKKVYLEIGNPIRIKVKRYFCKRIVVKNHRQNFLVFYEKFCNFSNEFKENIKLSREYSWIPLRSMKKLIKICLGQNVSHETIRKALLVDGDFYYVNEDLKPSGYYGYDEQWEKVNGKWIYYLVIFDLIHNVPVASILSEKLSKDIIKNFIDKSIPLKDRIAIVTDLKIEYDEIMRELKFVHQHCIFHLEKNIKNKMEEKINKNMIKYKFKLINTTPKLSNYQIEEKIKKEKNKRKTEMWKYIKEFTRLFKKENITEAIGYINQIKKKIKDYPKDLAKYLQKNFFPEYRKYLHFLETAYKGKLDPTNNKLENFNGNTMPKYEKKFIKQTEDYGVHS